MIRLRFNTYGLPKRNPSKSLSAYIYAPRIRTISSSGQKTFRLFRRTEGFDLSPMVYLDYTAFILSGKNHYTTAGVDRCPFGFADSSS